MVEHRQPLTDDPLRAALERAPATQTVAEFLADYGPPHECDDWHDGECSRCAALAASATDEPKGDR